MQLTRHSDYSLRVLIYLALRPDELANISDIARIFNVSKNHLVKVVHQLSKIGYIKTTRGHGGGLKLAVKPAKISVGDVIRQTERRMEVINCHEPVCPILPACQLKIALNQATDAFLEVLDGYTVSDLTREKKLLRKLTT